VGGARPGRAFVGSRREGKNRSEAIDNEGALGLFRERRGMPGQPLRRSLLRRPPARGREEQGLGLCARDPRSLSHRVARRGPRGGSTGVALLPGWFFHPRVFRTDRRASLGFGLDSAPPSTTALPGFLRRRRHAARSCLSSSLLVLGPLLANFFASLSFFLSPRSPRELRRLESWESTEPVMGLPSVSR